MSLLRDRSRCRRVPRGRPRRVVGGIAITAALTLACFAPVASAAPGASFKLWIVDWEVDYPNLTVASEGPAERAIRYCKSVENIGLSVFYDWLNASEGQRFSYRLTIPNGTVVAYRSKFLKSNTFVLARGNNSVFPTSRSAPPGRYTFSVVSNDKTVNSSLTLVEKSC
jgi:hypothetical protein